MKKIVVIPRWFEPTDEFRAVLKGRRGVIDAADVVEYMEKHSERFRSKDVLKGRQSSDFRIGFAGYAYLMEVDETRMWILKYDNIDRPYIQYVRAEADHLGQLQIYYEEQSEDDSKNIQM